MGERDREGDLLRERKRERGEDGKEIGIRSSIERWWGGGESIRDIYIYRERESEGKDERRANGMRAKEK